MKRTPDISAGSGPRIAGILRRSNNAADAEVVGDIHGQRIDDSISAGVLLEAGILSGPVFRLGGFQPGREVAAMNDATIYLHALEHGYTVLTRNIRDFDLMNQIVSPGRVLLYRTI